MNISDLFRKTLFIKLCVAFLCIAVLIYATPFAGVMAAWNTFTTLKDGYEILDGVVGGLTIEKENLAGKVNECWSDYEEELEYFMEWVNKLTDLNLKIGIATDRVEAAQEVVNNCLSQLETAQRGISYFKKRLQEVESGSEAAKLWESLKYWQQVYSYWTSQLSSAQSTLSSEKYTLAMYVIEHAEVRSKLWNLQFVLQSYWSRWQDAVELLENKVAELELKVAELEAITSQMVSAISDITTALNNLTSRLDANEQLDEKQQQQIDNIEQNVKAIAEHLGIEYEE